jgi:NAD(P)H-hydrate repair Nnr-like enzyme with NAD(P)H-hydrate dehydratase domain
VQEIPGVEQLSNFTLFVKGNEDLILSSKKSFIVRTMGSGKRCGGLGDILSGAIAVCSLWDQTYGPVLAARIVRLATRTAFEKEGRGLTAPVVMGELTQVVKSIESASL